MAKTKTKKRRTTTGASNDIDTANALVDLEYGPQFAAVRDAYNSATTQYHRDLSGARQTARAIQGSARQADPKLRSVYNAASRGLDATNAETDAAIAAVQTGSTPLSGLLGQMMQRERGAAQNRITDEKADALAELKTKGVEAEAGRAMAYGLAKSNLKDTRKQLTQKLADLTGLRGSALSLKLSEMQAASDAASAESNKTITSGPFAGMTRAEIDALSPKERREIGAGTPDKKDDTQHKRDVRKETGNFSKTVEDIQSDWSRLAGTLVPKMKWDPKADKGKGAMVRVLDDNKQPVMEKPTPSELKDILRTEYKYDPGAIHIALLRRVGKPLDAEALRYMKSLAGRGVRIPRAWLMNDMDRRIASGEAAGPPRPLGVK